MRVTEPIRWTPAGVVMLDQRRLPTEEIYHTYTDYRGVAAAIKDMIIRGAPAIGVAAAMGVEVTTTASPSAADRRLRGRCHPVLQRVGGRGERAGAVRRGFLRRAIRPARRHRAGAPGRRGAGGVGLRAGPAPLRHPAACLRPPIAQRFAPASDPSASRQLRSRPNNRDWRAMSERGPGRGNRSSATRTGPTTWT